MMFIQRPVSNGLLQSSVVWAGKRPAQGGRHRKLELPIRVSTMFESCISLRALMWLPWWTAAIKVQINAVELGKSCGSPGSADSRGILLHC